MKVFADNVIEDRAIDRISRALKKFAPSGIRFVTAKEESDLVILYANGRLHRFNNEIDSLLSQGKKVAIVQVAIRSTRNPSTADWLPLWKKAKVVWSYYNLKALCDEDKTTDTFNFYHAPLGVDEAFREYQTRKKYIIATNGRGYSTESARECILAANAVGERVFHIGPVITNKPGVDFSQGMNDNQLAQKYSQCEFVSGLRRTEGFELPVIEGMVCGARPIVFDRPHYRRWFDGLAIFIPETERDDILKSLIEIFKKGAVPVTQDEIEKIRKRFNWKTIVEGFWKYI